jgi:hypothetical protein
MIEHPEHPVPRAIKEAFDRRHQHQLEAAAGRARLAELLRPDDRARKDKAALVEALGRVLGVDAGKYGQTVSDRFERLNSDEVFARQPYDDIFQLRPVDMAMPQPAAADHHFWWADTDWWHDSPYTAESRDDGLWFFGRMNYDGASTTYRQFGVRARFELQPERIPASSSGRWRSDPFVELWGGMLGFTLNGGVFSGDFWANCWMRRRQTLVHSMSDGPRYLGEAVEVPQVIRIENHGTTRAFVAPGYQPMPPLVITGVTPGLSIWAELEVRFEIQLEGDSGMWTGVGGSSHHLVVRHFQWPLISL